MDISEAFAEGIIKSLILLWPFWIFVGVVVLVRALLAVREWRRLARSGIREIDRMDGKTFEKYLEVLFTRLGFHVERTRYIGDYGADLVVLKDGKKTIVQAKRSRRRVGVKAIQQAVAAKPV